MLGGWPEADTARYGSAMADIGDIERLASGDQGLVTFSISRTDGSVHSSVVNAGLMAHPVSGERVVATVLRGPSWKLQRLREHPRCTILFRVGWEWASVDGPAELIGPVDSFPGFEPAGVPQLLRDVFTAAGGTHDDWDEYDRAMVEDGRTAVFIRPSRIQGRG